MAKSYEAKTPEDIVTILHEKSVKDGKEALVLGYYRTQDTAFHEMMAPVLSKWIKDIKDIDVIDMDELHTKTHLMYETMLALEIEDIDGVTSDSIKLLHSKAVENVKHIVLTELDDGIGIQLDEKIKSFEVIWLSRFLQKSIHLIN